MVTVAAEDYQLLQSCIFWAFAVEKRDIQKANMALQAANPPSLRMPPRSVQPRQGRDRLQNIILHNWRLTSAKLSP